MWLLHVVTSRHSRVRPMSLGIFSHGFCEMSTYWVSDHLSIKLKKTFELWWRDLHHWWYVVHCSWHEFRPSSRIILCKFHGNSNIELNGNTYQIGFFWKRFVAWNEITPRKKSNLSDFCFISYSKNKRTLNSLQNFIFFSGILNVLYTLTVAI